MAKQVVDDVKNGDLAYISLRSIRTDVYPNMRNMNRERGSDHIQEMRESLKARGQQQSVQVEKMLAPDGKETGEYALLVGFCRTEAMRQNALDSIARKHNKNVTEATAAGNTNTAPKLDVTVAADQQYIEQHYPEEFAKAMLAQVKANIIVVPGDNPEQKAQNALAINMTENFVRKDPSVAEFAYRVCELSDQGLTSKEIEKLTGIDEQKLKQNMTVGSIFNKKYLSDFLLNLDDGNNSVVNPWSELQRTAWMESVEKVVNEVIRRMSVSRKDNPGKQSLAISFSHLREVSARFNASGNKRIHRLAAFELLVELVGWSVDYVYNEEGQYVDIVINSPDKSDCPDFGVWKSQIKAADTRSSDFYNHNKGLYGGLFDSSEATTASDATKTSEVEVEAKADSPATAGNSTVPANKTEGATEDADDTTEDTDDATEESGASTTGEINDAILEGDTTAAPEGTKPAADPAIAKGKRAEKDETELPMRTQIALLKHRKTHLQSAVEVIPDPYNPDGEKSEGPVNIGFYLGFAAALAYAYTDDASEKLYDTVYKATEIYEEKFELYIRMLESKLASNNIKLDSSRPYLSDIITADGQLVDIG